MPVVLANSPKDSHDQPNDRNNPSFPFSSVHVTRSQITKSSSPVPVSVALDPFRFPVSVAEKDSVICRLNLQIELLEREIAQTKAELRASNAHCTLMTRAASEVMTSLENQKRKTRRSAKTSARYLTQKATEDAARKVRIRSEIAARTFSGVLLSSILTRFLILPRSPGFIQAQGRSYRTLWCPWPPNDRNCHQACGTDQVSSRCKSRHPAGSQIFWALSTASTAAGGTYSLDRIGGSLALFTPSPLPLSLTARST